MRLWFTELLTLAGIALCMANGYIAFSQAAPERPTDEPQLAPYTSPADFRR